MSTSTLQVIANGAAVSEGTRAKRTKKVADFSLDDISRLMLLRERGEVHFGALQTAYERALDAEEGVHKQNFRRYFESMSERGLVSIRNLSEADAIRNTGGRPATAMLKLTAEGEQLIDDYIEDIRRRFPRRR